jgi:hypothetical protein
MWRFQMRCNCIILREVEFRCFDSFYEFLETEFVELLQTQKVKDKDFDVSNFLYVLRPFYKGW